MKRLVYLLIICLSVCCGIANADFLLNSFSTFGGGGGGPDTYYYGVGSDSYPSTSNWGPANGVNGDNITVVSGGQITTIGVKFPNSDVDNFKVMLAYDDSGTWTLHECLESSGISPGWNDLTLTTPYTVASSEVVLVTMINETANLTYRNNLTGGLGDGTHTNYSTFCSWDPDSVGDDTQVAVRVYVD